LFLVARVGAHAARPVGRQALGRLPVHLVQRRQERLGRAVVGDEEPGLADVLGSPTIVGGTIYVAGRQIIALTSAGDPGFWCDKWRG
jgi:hypothetical protein